MTGSFISVAAFLADADLRAGIYGMPAVMPRTLALADAAACLPPSLHLPAAGERGRQASEEGDTSEAGAEVPSVAGVSNWGGARSELSGAHSDWDAGSHSEWAWGAGTGANDEPSSVWGTESGSGRISMPGLRVSMRRRLGRALDPEHLVHRSRLVASKASASAGSLIEDLKASQVTRLTKQ